MSPYIQRFHGSAPAWRRGWVLVACVLVCLLLGASLVRRQHVLGDCAELAGAIAEPGIAHPPGYAAYTMLGHGWGVLLRALTGTRVPWLVATNLFSLAWALVAVGFWLACWRQLAGGAARRSLAAHGLAAGMLLFWFGHPLMLLRSATTEVYAMHLGLIGAVWWLVMRLEHARPRHGVPPARLVFMLSLVGALGCLHHATFVLAVPPVLLAVACVLWRRGGLQPGDWVRGLLTSVAGLLAGVATLAYLWFRSRQLPQINWGMPGADWQSFWRHISAAQYRFYLHGGGPTNGVGFWARLPGVDRLLLLSLPVLPLAAVAITRAWRHLTGAWRSLLIGCLALHAALALGFNLLYAIRDINEYFLPIWWLTSLLGAAALGRLGATLPAAARRQIMPWAGVLLLGLGAVWTGINYRTAARQEARMAYRAGRVVERWHNLPAGAGTVMISTDAIGLLNFEQVVEGSHRELLICGLHDFRRLSYLREISARLRLAPILFYEDGQLDPASLRFSENLAPLVKRNFWARVPGRLIDFDAALGLGGEALVRSQNVAEDFAIEVIRAGLAQPGDILPLHKTLAQFRAQMGRLPRGYDAELWNAGPAAP